MKTLSRQFSLGDYETAKAFSKAADIDEKEKYFCNIQVFPV